MSGMDSDEVCKLIGRNGRVEWERALFSEVEASGHKRLGHGKGQWEAATCKQPLAVLNIPYLEQNVNAATMLC